METSLFTQYVAKWFIPFITTFVELINGKEEDQPTYLHDSMLRKEFSTTLKWGSMTSDGRAVAADVVSMDSSLPLKRRDAIRKAEGDIPKLGMKLYLNERTMSDIDILSSDPNRENEIVRKLFADVKKCYLGVKEQVEYMFLYGLSHGVTIIEEENNTGAAIRIDFEYDDDNIFGATAGKWSSASAEPISDIENVMQRAEEKGHTLRYAMMERKTFNAMRKHDDIRELFGASQGFTGNNFPAPTLSQLNEAMQDNYGFEIRLIDRTVTVEKNGVRKALKPWADGRVVFTTTLDVGTLTYGRLAEQNRPVPGVAYETAEDYILLSKYSKNDPLREWSSSQALAIPVINNVNEIYVLDVEDYQSEAQTEGDANFDYKGTAYTRASVIAAINEANPEAGAKDTQSDAWLERLINELSNEEVAVFESKIVAAV